MSLAHPMQFLQQLRSLRDLAILVFLILGSGAVSPAAYPQDSSGDTTGNRGNRAEVSITVRDNSREVVSVPASIKLLHDGIPINQTITSRGRAFFILPNFGDYTIAVEAVGYKPSQRDISVNVAVKYEMDINLLKEADPNSVSGVPGAPLLAPKAKEALEKGMQALKEDNLRQADKYLQEAMKLAPGNPDVLYIQGVLDLKQQDWTKAQTILEKATQIDPNHARAYSALGMALCNQKKYNDAISPLEKSLQLETNAGWETHWALAESYYHQERYEDALKQSQQAKTQANGRVPQVELLYAKSLTAMDRFEDAAQALRDFLKEHANDKDAPTAQRWLDGLKANGKIR